MPQAPENQCSRCKGRGFTRNDVPYGHPDFGQIIRCQCLEEELKAKRQLKLLKASGLCDLDQYYTGRFETFNETLPGVTYAYQQAEKFASCEVPYQWLVFAGPYGCGKTHLATAIAHARIEAGQTVYFATVPDLLDYFRTAFNPESGDTYAKRWEEVRTADLLVLDDLGAQKDTPWAEEKLFQLLNHRYSGRKWTVITTNQIHLVGVAERIKSRMLDTSIVKIITMLQAKDHRQTKKTRYLEIPAAGKDKNV
jgi:DNA replication protein DnaC